jgi:hypothetical protein
MCLSGHIQVEEEDEVWGNDMWTRGQILVTLCYSTRRRALLVGIVRCINLQPMDSNGFSDPFVKLYVSCTCNYLTFVTYQLMICICRNWNILCVRNVGNNKSLPLFGFNIIVFSSNITLCCFFLLVRTDDVDPFPYNFHRMCTTYCNVH